MRVGILALCMRVGWIALWSPPEVVIISAVAVETLVVAMALMALTSLLDRLEGTYLLQLVLDVEDRERAAYRGLDEEQGA